MSRYKLKQTTVKIRKNYFLIFIKFSQKLLKKNVFEIGRFDG